MAKFKIDFQEVKEKVEDLVRAAAKESLPGEEKAKLVVDQLVKWFDDKVEYPGVAGKALDAIDAPILRFVLGSLVHQAYKYLRERGTI